MADGARELVADRVHVCRQDIEQDQPHISGEKRHSVQQGREQEQNDKAGRCCQQAGGKDAVFVRAALQTIPDHTVGDSHRGDGDDQIAGLQQQIRHAVFRAGEDAGVERRQQEGEKPGTECADAEQHCICHQAFVGIQRTRPPSQRIVREQERGSPASHLILRRIFKQSINRR